MRYTNHKQSWTMFDRNGKEVARHEQDGWENIGGASELAGEENYLIEDEEGDIEFSPAEFITHSALLHEETQEITCADTVIGTLVYRRECEVADEN